ncbi:MAG: helicase [Dehalococcoidia bacterium]|nr:helicase [Dehalococcoidia bacterium]
MALPDLALPPLPAQSHAPYAAFIHAKTQCDGDSGFAPIAIPDVLFDFQKALVEWAIRRGRAALYEDCGLGKSPQELTWADNVVRKTNGAVLLLTPLAVSQQMIAEGEKFGIPCQRAQRGSIQPGIHVTNYERLHHFDSNDFVGIVCDESGILKNFDGETRAAVTRFAAKLPYRLLGTATAAPNDFIELGTSSEALGYLGFMDMLSRFFKNNRNNSATNPFGRDAATRMPQWRFRGHAEKPFWRWVASWARCLRKPSDFGFDDGPFLLPELIRREHIVKAAAPREGFLFAMPAVGLAEEREERRRTLTERCEMAARLVAHDDFACVWCHLNDEGDLLTKLIPGAVQVSGKDSDDAKEEKFQAFSTGKVRKLVIKPKIGAWGLNWQHCAHLVSFASHSFESDYQSVRRFWRFGQKRPVLAEYVISDGEERVLKNLQNKAAQADKMFAEIIRHTQDALGIARGRVFAKEEEIPSWL